MFLSKFIFLSAFGVLGIVASSEFECCPCSNIMSGTCADGTVCGIIHAPNLCCGHHTCDAFCCDCGGGWRTRSEAGASNGVSTALSKLDKDSSGDLDLKEFNDYNTKNNIPKEALINTIFKLMDLNGDGHVSVKELNTVNKPKSTGHSEL